MDYQYTDWEGQYQKIYSSDVKGDYIRLNSVCGVGIYAGVPTGHNFTVRFMTKKEQLTLPETELLKVSCVEMSDGSKRTILESMSEKYSEMLYTFAVDLVKYVGDTKGESEAVKKVQERYAQWKGLFSSSHKHMPLETQRGLLGELLFLRDYMFENFTYHESIMAWSGPKKTSKDFAFDQYWYEVKTTNATSSEVLISSTAQLAGPLPGQLIVYRLDETAPTYQNPEATSVLDVARNIYRQIAADQDVVVEFIQRLSSLDFPFHLLLNDTPVDQTEFAKFIVQGPTFYDVNDDFPRITDTSCFDGAISKVRYALLLNMLDKFEAKEMRR